MVVIDIAYQGRLRCNARHQPSGTVIATDAPLDNQGRGESFSPTDLVATALGSCILTIMGIFAERHGVDLSRARVSVAKHMVADPQRRIARLEVDIVVPGVADHKLRAALEAAASGCPVKRSIEGSIQVVERFHWS
jgi:putative redox protein